MTAKTPGSFFVTRTPPTEAELETLIQKAMLDQEAAGTVFPIAMDVIVHDDRLKAIARIEGSASMPVGLKDQLTTALNKTAAACLVIIIPSDTNE